MRRLAANGSRGISRLRVRMLKAWSLKASATAESGGWKFKLHAEIGHLLPDVRRRWETGDGYIKYKNREKESVYIHKYINIRYGVLAC